MTYTVFSGTLNLTQLNHSECCKYLCTGRMSSLADLVCLHGALLVKCILHSNIMCSVQLSLVGQQPLLNISLLVAI